eukprot:3994373-Prymnesium_polylepis.1
MKTRPTQFHLGRAPSSRSRCLGCRKPIGKGQPRLVLTLAVTPRRTARKSRCLECLDRRLAEAVVRACGSAGALPVAVDVKPEAAEALKARLSVLVCSGHR